MSFATVQDRDRRRWQAVVSLDAKRAAERLARHFGLTVAGMVERLALNEAARVTAAGLPARGLSSGLQPWNPKPIGPSRHRAETALNGQEVSSFLLFDAIHRVPPV
jgi:hypothetical protein